MAALSADAKLKDDKDEDLAGCRVTLHGLKGAAELNFREGIVHGSVDSSTGRYEVHLDAGKGPDVPARTVTVKPTNLKPARPAALVGRPGPFRASYDWREVLPDQALPRGLEILGSVDENDPRPTIARIPEKWKLEVSVTGSADAAPLLRLDVGSRSTLGEVQAELRKHLRCPERTAAAAGEGWPALLVDGTRLADPAMTVAYAQLFGKRVSCSVE